MRAVLLILFAVSTLPGAVVGEITTTFDFMLMGTGGIPLGRAMGPAQPDDSAGFRFVMSKVTISGKAVGKTIIQNNGDGNVGSGSPLNIFSEFNLMFGAKIEDIDPVNNFFPALASPIMRSGFSSKATLESAGCAADLSKPNFGCFPPVGATFSGTFETTIPFPFDINGDGANDSIHILASMNTIRDLISTAILGSEHHAVVTLDAMFHGSVNPPFSIPLDGEILMKSTLLHNPVPEPAAGWLLSAGLGGLWWMRRRR